MQEREIIADNLSKAGWSWGCVSALDSSEPSSLLASRCRDVQRSIVRPGPLGAPGPPSGDGNNGGGGNTLDARETSNMKARNSSDSTNRVGRIRMDNMDNSHSRIRIRFRWKSEHQNAARERKPIHLPPMQSREA